MYVSVHMGVCTRVYRCAGRDERSILSVLLNFFLHSFLQILFFFKKNCVCVREREEQGGMEERGL